MRGANIHIEIKNLTSNCFPPNPISAQLSLAASGSDLNPGLAHSRSRQLANRNDNNAANNFGAPPGCKFYPIGENRRFERVAENLPVGSELFKIEAHPRSEFKIEPIDNSLSDVNYFKYVDLDDRFVAIKLNQSLEELVDRVSLPLANTDRRQSIWLLLLFNQRGRVLLGLQPTDGPVGQVGRVALERRS